MCVCVCAHGTLPDANLLSMLARVSPVTLNVRRFLPLSTKCDYNSGYSFFFSQTSRLAKALHATLEYEKRLFSFWKDSFPPTFAAPT